MRAGGGIEEHMPKVEKQTPGPMIEFGVSGLKHSGGMIREEFARELQGRRGIKAFRTMRDEDPIIGGVMLAVETLIRQVEKRVEPASMDRRDQDAAEFLESTFNDMSTSWPDTLAEILSALTYGWSAFEIVYKRREDGRVGWRKWAPRSQDSLLRWVFDPSGGIQGLVQSAPPDFKPRPLPIEKLLLFRAGTHKGSPEGRSLLRAAYRSWWRKTHIENIEGIGIERDLAGLPVVHAPAAIMAGNASANDKATFANLKELVRNIRRDEQEGVVFPQAYDGNANPLYKLELLSTGGRRQFDTNAIIGRLDARMAMSILADFILLGHEKVGSFALSSSKTSLFATAIGALLQSTYGVINRHAVPRLFALNTFGVRELPQVVHGDIESRDLKELGDFVERLARAGARMFPDDALENALRAEAHLPPLPEEEMRPQLTNGEDLDADDDQLGGDA